MQHVPITSLYAALLAMLFVALSARAIRGRRASRLSLGVAGDAVLERIVRVHANFAEYVPIALVLLLLAELDGLAPGLLHLAGLALVTGRAVHAFGVSRTPEDFRLRVAGVATTLTVIVTLAVALLARLALGGI